MRALVTGGQGFVGRHLIDALTRAGFDVVSVDPLIDGGGGKPPTQQPGYDWCPMDCREYFTRTTSSSQFDVVFHLAAVVGGRITIEKNPLAVADDLSIDAALFKWISPGTHLVYFSSSAAYPVDLQTGATEVRLTETDIDFESARLGLPDLSYGWAKLTGEYLAKLAAARHGITSSIYRPFSGYGEDQDLAYPVPSICRREANRLPGEPAHVWGSGQQCRDFVHIDDVVAAIMATWQLGQTLNISTGVPTSFIDVARLAAHDPDLPVTTDTGAPTGVGYRVGDTTRQQQVGVEHRISLADGLARCVEFWLPRV